MNVLGIFVNTAYYTHDSIINSCFLVYYILLLPCINIVHYFQSTLRACKVSC